MAGERTAGDGKLFIVVVELAFLLILVLIRLQCLIGFGGEAAVLYLNLTKALVAGTVHYGDSRAVLNGAVILGLGHRIAGDGDGALSGDLQTAGADLHAHSLGVDGAVVDGQRAAAGEVDAEAVGHVQRAILQRDGIVGVVAVGLDTAVAFGRHGDILEHQPGVVVGNGAAHSGGDQAHHGVTDHSTVLHGQRHIGVVDLERGAIRISAGVGPSVAVQVDGEALTAGVLLRAGGVVTQQIERLTRRNSSVECLVHGVVGGFADLGKVGLGNTERTVTVLSDRRIFGHILGGVLLKRTAGDLNGGLGGVSGSSQTIVIGIGAQRTIDGAAGDADLGHLALGAAVVHREHVTVDGAAADRQIAVVPAAVRPGRHCAVDRAALDGSSVPVLNGVAIGGVQRAAVQDQIAAIDLDGNEVVLLKRAAIDSQFGDRVHVSVVADADEGRALAAIGVAAVVLDVAAFEGQQAFALNVDNIVGGNAGVLRGILTHNGTGLCLAAVLDGHAGHTVHAVLNGQCGLALLGAAVQSEAVQVEGQPLVNGDVLPGIRQQGHGIIALCRVNSRLQGLVLAVRVAVLIQNLCDIIRLAHAVGAVLGAVLAAACTAGLFVNGCACGRTRAFSCTGFSCRPCACAQAQRHDQRQNGC